MAPLLNATMLYRSGITEKIHGVAVDYTVVDESEVDAMLEDGWYRTPAGVKEAASADAAKTDEATQKPAPKK